MKQILVSLEKKDNLNLELLTPKQKELVALGMVLLRGPKQNIAAYVRRALDAGASHEEILKIVAFAIGDERLFDCILELLRILRIEENVRQPYISIVTDCREE